jgi:hypothetical protein
LLTTAVGRQRGFLQLRLKKVTLYANDTGLSDECQAKLGFSSEKYAIMRAEVIHIEAVKGTIYECRKIDG